MPTMTLPFETWRAIIDALRAKNLPYMVEHADDLEKQLEQHAPDGECSVTTHPTWPTVHER